MDATTHFHRLFAYDQWANREILAVLLTAPARSLELMAHILAGQHVWFDRLKQQTQTFPVWPTFTLEQCAQQANELSQLWNDYLSTAEYDRIITYKNTFGEPWTNRVEDILTHVIAHSVYHRGQIATNMREAGLTPAYTDYIHSIRQGFVE
jgi:uncharacterized damage-inducible protein DinB